MLSVVDPIYKLLLNLPTSIDGLMLQVGILVERDAFQCSDKLIYLLVAVRTRIIAYPNEICNMLFRVALSVEMLQFWWLMMAGYGKCINPLYVRLGVEVRFAHNFTSCSLTAFIIKS